MKRILFLCLWALIILQTPTRAEIEIYADGHKYVSLQAYQDSERSLALQPSAQDAAALSSQQDDYIREETKQLGMDVDLGKIKTLRIAPSDLSGTTRRQLFVLSVENGVAGALQDFYSNRAQGDVQTPQKISSDQLQEVIQQAVTKSKEPTLLIAQPGKMRIMSLKPDK